jgi:hypothetical protein
MYLIPSFSPCIIGPLDAFTNLTLSFSSSCRATSRLVEV